MTISNVFSPKDKSHFLAIFTHKRIVVTPGGLSWNFYRPSIPKKTNKINVHSIAFS